MAEIDWQDISVADMDYLLIDHAGFIDGDKHSVIVLDNYRYPLSMNEKEK